MPAEDPPAPPVIEQPEAVQPDPPSPSRKKEEDKKKYLYNHYSVRSTNRPKPLLGERLPALAAGDGLVDLQVEMHLLDVPVQRARLGEMSSCTFFKVKSGGIPRGPSPNLVSPTMCLEMSGKCSNASSVFH